jgi:hypothetical protein
MWEQKFLFAQSGSSSGPRGLKNNVELVWECRQAICVLSDRNSVTPLGVRSDSGIQGSKDGDSFTMKGPGILLLHPEPGIPISPCNGRLIIKEWLTENCSEYWTGISGMRQSKLFIEGHSGDLLASDRETCRLVTRFLTGQYTLRQHLHVMGLR